MKTHNKIRQARISAGYTQKQLATLLKVTQQAIQQWEKPGGTSPKMPHLLKLSKILGLSLDTLLIDNDDSTQDKSIFFKSNALSLHN